MKRIFLTLTILSTAVLVAALVLGLLIEDAKSPTAAAQAAVSNHFLTGLGGLVFASLVHAIVLTYFMGTGRWIEETASAYSLGDEYQSRNRSLKYRTLVPMGGCLLLLVLLGVSGAWCDPAAAGSRATIAGASSATVHLVLSLATLGLNLAVNVVEYRALSANGRLIEEVLADVNRIRREQGLPI